MGKNCLQYHAILSDWLGRTFLKWTMGAKYCYQRACLSVRWHVSKTTHNRANGSES